MRQTYCNFNSPKSGEFVYPLVTAYGKKIAYERDFPLTQNRKPHTMGLEKRFRDQDLLLKM